MKQNDIIKLSLMELGFRYADEDLEESQEYKAAEVLVKAIVTEVNLDENMPYNKAYIRPALSDTQDIPGKNIYIKPPRCLKVLNRDIEEYGDLLVTEKNLEKIDYLKEVSLEDIPEIYVRYITLLLALRLARTAGKPKAIESVYPLLQEEKEKISFTENTLINIEDLQ